tara:strand:+ start:16 stop:669 length:654 start_codon:yes stop_codon:yes gene_type:complete
MPYIGNSPGTGVRNRFIYTATASQTTFTGADDNGKTLKYADSDLVDVFLNGVCLVPVTDYTSTSKTSVVLAQAASLNDTLEIISYDIASIADNVSKANGGTFNGLVTFSSAVAKVETNATATGSLTLDFSLNQNFILTLTGNVTLANPSTETVGQSGFIVFIQDGTGGRTVSLGTDYETAGAAGITLSTAASSTDLVPYIVVASNRILLGAPQLAFA